MRQSLNRISEQIANVQEIDVTAIMEQIGLSGIPCLIWNDAEMASRSAD